MDPNKFQDPFPKHFQRTCHAMARTLASERAAQAAERATQTGANPSAAPVAAMLTAAEPVTALTAAALPTAKPTGRLRAPTARYKPEAVIKSRVRKARGKTAKNDIYIRGFYAVCIAENTKPKWPRRDRMQFAYRYVVDERKTTTAWSP